LSRERDYGYRFAQILKKKRWMIEFVMKSEKKYLLSILSRAQIPYHIVEISLFDNPTIHVDGKEIKSESWKTAKAMKLFCYLCTKRRKPISRDILIDSLWPGASLRSGSMNLRKAMQHIRQALSETIHTDDKPIQYKGNFYTISPHLSVWIDTEEYIHTIEQILQSNHLSEKQRDDLTKAVALYESGLAKGWYDDWVEEMRSYYNKLYEKCLLMLVDYYIEKNNNRESIVWLNKLIKENYYEEEYHKKLWTIYARLKKFTAIQEDFTALEKAFKKEMKAQLQPETIALYESLIK
jgi:DNA-binding SARP family transcriptional activator